jgi:hypothetical protein
MFTCRMLYYNFLMVRSLNKNKNNYEKYANPIDTVYGVIIAQITVWLYCNLINKSLEL